MHFSVTSMHKVTCKNHRARGMGLLWGISKRPPVEREKMPRHPLKIDGRMIFLHLPPPHQINSPQVKNVPVHFGSKVRRSVEDAQNVPVHFGSKVRKRPKCTTTFKKPDEQVLAK